MTDKQRIAKNIKRVQKLFFKPLIWAISAFIAVMLIMSAMDAAQNPKGYRNQSRIFEISLIVGGVMYGIVFIVLLFKYYLIPAQQWIDKNAE